jgi:amino acid adenylation domain-containing protein
MDVSREITNIRDAIDARSRVQPETAFLISPETGKTVSFHELRQQSVLLSGMLRQAGLEKGDKVAFLMDNGLLTAQLFLGTMYGGFVAVPLNVRAGVSHMAYMLDHCDARAVFVEDQYSALLSEALGSTRRDVRVIAVNVDSPVPVFETVPGNPALLSIDAGDVGLLMYSSGSTGKPKGAIHTHSSILAHGRNSIAAHQLSSADRSLLVLPLYHINAECVTLIPTLLSGGSVVVAHRFIVSAFWDWISDLRVTWSALVPTIISELVDWDDPGKDRRQPAFERIRFFRSSSAPLAPTLHRQFLDKFNLPLLQAMGSTEGGNVFSNPQQPGKNKVGSPGLPWGFETRIVDREGADVPRGESGEVLLRGAALMKGYYKDPEGTEAVVDTGGWLHTGDLARQDEDGYFFVVGRSKELIIKGGVNIAPRQIDEVLESHPAVLEAAAVGVPDRYFGEDAVAFVVLRSEPAADERELLAFCETRLGHFKTPSRIHFLKELPKGPSGKVQRLRLLDPEVLAAVAVTTQPASEAVNGKNRESDSKDPSAGFSIEQIISTAWAEVLALPQVDPQANFFALGGHSLLAIQCLSKLRFKLPSILSLADFFEFSTVAEQAELVRQRMRSGNEAADGLKPTNQSMSWEQTLLQQYVPPPAEEGIPQRDSSLPYPLSPAQQRLWFMEQLNPDVPVYNEAEAVLLTGELHVDALESAFNVVVDRHEVLRSTIEMIEGVPHAVRHKSWPLCFRKIDLSTLPPTERQPEVDRLLIEEPRALYDLEAEPGIRVTLIRLSPREHVFILMMHHIICDWASEGIIWRELSALYGSFLSGKPVVLPLPSVTHGDYAAWQQQRLTTTSFVDDLVFWEEALRDAPPLLELPADRPRPPAMSYRGGRLRWKLDAALTEALRKVGRQEKTSLFTVFAAALNTLIYRYSGVDDILLGIPLADRDQPELQSLIGFLLHTHVLRTRLSGNMTFRELLKLVQKEVLDLYIHRTVPFDQIVQRLQPERNLSYSPLFQVMLNWRDRDQMLPFIGLEGLAVDSLMASAETSKFDLLLLATDTGDEIWLEMEFSTDLFEEDRIARMLGHYQSLLEAVAADPGASLSELPLLAAAELHQVVFDWNDTAAEYPRNVSLAKLVEEQVERTPDAVAVIYEDGSSISYRGLNERANQLAHELRKHGACPDQLVGICLKRSIDMIVALLAIVKAGAAYVPLDPDLPSERLGYMIDDSGLRILLTQRDLRSSLPPLVATIIEVDNKEWQVNSRENPEISVSPENLIHVIYTSGSTGRPKGVQVPRSALINLLWCMRDLLPLKSGDISLAVTTISFDIAGVDVWLPLLAGARSVIASRNSAADGQRLLEMIERHNVKFLQATPTTWRLLLAAGWKGKSDLVAVCTGEAMPRELAAQLHPVVARLWNLYGPTETTIWSTSWLVEKGDEPVLIGRPVANTQCYLLDPGGQPVPVGVAGELYIAGDGLARGYLNLPELTDEKFIPNPFNPGQHMYRTGDLARYRPDGNIECLGRNDFQVKIRGFRIELGEIEAILADHPAVREAMVIAREDTPGDKRLVAYYTAATNNGSVDVEQLRSHLSAKVPEYMLPAAYVSLDSLPLTPNGKLNRKALPAPGADAYFSRVYEPPQGETEIKLAAIWAEVLKLGRVGRRDNFFELGGHSLLAVRVMTRIRHTLDREVELNILFRHQALADLALALESAARIKLPPVRPVERDGHLPVSFAQQRLWFLAQIEGLSEAYHIPVSLRLTGKLDNAALRRALVSIMARHEALRTTFALVDGAPVQRFTSKGNSRFPLLEHDLRGHNDVQAELERLTAEETATSFDLEAGPLIRGRLIRISDEEHTLLITMHHIVSDGWSLGILVNEMSALYSAYLRGAADPLPELRIQYADYAVWQRSWIEGEIMRQQVEYWKETLSGAPALLELPADHPRPAQQDFAGDRLELVLDEQLTNGLRELGRRHGATLFMTLMAAWAALLSRLSGQSDIVVGTPVANRGRAEIENLIGFFVNTLTLRIDLSGSPTVAQLLMRARNQSLAALHHQDVPFEHVVEMLQPVRSLSHSPLFQVMFVWQNNAPGVLDLPGLEILRQRSSPQRVSKFDLLLALAEAGGRIVGGLEYATSLFERSTIERYLGHFRTMLEAMVVDDSQLVDRLPMLTKAEQHRMVHEWNDTAAEYPINKCIHQLFEEQVSKSPDAVAVVFEGGDLSYAELNRRANRLAHYLRELNVQPDDRVAICMERGPEMVIGLLAVLKAGCAYVPLDPAYPAGRLCFMMRDSKPIALLTQNHMQGLVVAEAAAEKVTVVRLNEDEPRWSSLPDSNPDLRPIGLSSNNLAYVIYTSGSTGQPKGVAMQHSSLVNLVCWQIGRSNSGSAPRTLQFAALGFDVSFQETFSTLCSGGELILIQESIRSNGRALLDLLAKKKVQRIYLPYVALHMLAQESLDAGATEGEKPGCSTLLEINTAGEQLRIDKSITSFIKRFDSCRLQNQYGPSETHVASSFRLAEDTTTWPTHPPIGRPIANSRMYILNSHAELVPVGVAGELYIGGVAVARGYLNRPELTAERFLTDPFVAEPGARMYRTGDIARYLPDGNIEFLGRSDFQVKIRGFRVELGEIEAALELHPAIRQCAVLVRKKDAADHRLTAYIVLTDKQAVPTLTELRDALKQRLPDYMIPSAFEVLEKMPLTPNGKVDRKALGISNTRAISSEAQVEAPRDAIEAKLFEIWEQLLDVRPIGIHSNFFEVGGHSLLALKLFAQIKNAFRQSLPVVAIFGAPTIEQLAVLIRGRAINAASAPMEPSCGLAMANSSIVPIQPNGSAAPLFLIHGGMGHILGFYELAMMTGTDHPMYGVQAQSLMPGQPALLRLEDQAAYYLSEIRKVQPSGPYYLLGYCFGGIVAFEIAHQLSALGERVELLGLLDVAQRDHMPQVQQKKSTQPKVSLHTWLDRRIAKFRGNASSLSLGRKVVYASERILARILFRIYEIAPSLGLTSVPSFMKSTKEINFWAAEKYRARPWTGTVTLFRAADQWGPLVPRDLGWTPLAKGGVEVCDVPGDHFEVLRGANLAVLAERLRERLERSDSDSAQSQQPACSVN